MLHCAPAIYSCSRYLFIIVLMLVMGDTKYRTGTVPALREIMV